MSEIGLRGRERGRTRWRLALLDFAYKIDRRVWRCFCAGKEARRGGCRGWKRLLGVDICSTLRARTLGDVGLIGGGVRSRNLRKDRKVRMKDCSLHEKVYELLMWKGVEVRAFLPRSCQWDTSKVMMD